MSEHRSLPPDYRHTRATECARLRAVTFCRRLVAKPRTPHLHCAARAVLLAQSPQCWGSRGTPLAFLWGIQRGYSLRKENTPFVSCSATGAAFPAPRKGKSKGIPSSEREYPLCLVQRQQALPSPPLVRGNQKGYPLRKENTPFAWQWRSAPHDQCSATRCAPSPFGAQKKSRPMDGSHFCSISQCG